MGYVTLFKINGYKYFQDQIWAIQKIVHITLGEKGLDKVTKSAHKTIWTGNGWAPRWVHASMGQRIHPVG